MLIRRFLFAVLIVLSVTLFVPGLPFEIGSNHLTSATASDGSEIHPVSVPVILDGVRYEPQDFNRIQARLRLEGINLIFVLTAEAQKEGVIYAFTSDEKRKEFDLKRGRPADRIPPNQLRGKPLSRNIEPLTLQSSNSWFWADPYYAGALLSVPPNVSLADLRNVGGVNWNDRISSVIVQDGTEAWVWEHINFQGALLIGEGPLRVDWLGWYGWDDRISSLAVYYVV